MEAEGAEGGGEGAGGGEVSYVVAFAEEELTAVRSVVDGDGLAGVVVGKLPDQWGGVFDFDGLQGLWEVKGLVRVGRGASLVAVSRYSRQEAMAASEVLVGRWVGWCGGLVDEGGGDVPALALDAARVAEVGRVVGQGDGDGQVKAE